MHDRNGGAADPRPPRRQRPLGPAAAEVVETCRREDGAGLPGSCCGVRTEDVDDESFAGEVGSGFVDGAVKCPHLWFWNTQAVLFARFVWWPVPLPCQADFQWGGEHCRDRWQAGLGCDGQQRGSGAGEVVGAVDDSCQPCGASVREALPQKRAGHRVRRRIGRISGHLGAVSSIGQCRGPVSQLVSQDLGERGLACSGRAEQHHHARCMLADTADQCGSRFRKRRLRLAEVAHDDQR